MNMPATKCARARIKIHIRMQKEETDKASSIKTSIELINEDLSRTGLEGKNDTELKATQEISPN